MTTREIIQGFANEVYSDNLIPERAIELMKQMASIYGNVLDHIQETEFTYNKVLLEWLDKEKASSRAEINAKTSPEYQEFVMAKNTEKMLLKMLSSLKSFVESKKEEFRTAKYQ